MKATTVKRNRTRSYPNAARPEYYIHKIVDGLMMFLICAGLVTALAFVLTL